MHSLHSLQSLYSLHSFQSPHSLHFLYDSIATVGEIRVWWRADFQSGSRVLKKVSWTFSYLYLWHTMWFHAEKLLKTLTFWKLLYSLYKSGSNPQKSPKNDTLNHDLLKIFNRYGIFWMISGESSCPGGSEYVWQSGVEILQGRVMAGQSWSLF